MRPLFVNFDMSFIRKFIAFIYPSFYVSAEVLEIMLTSATISGFLFVNKEISCLKVRKSSNIASFLID